MAELTAESVHLVVTSPPYWQLKDYGNGRQMLSRFDVLAKNRLLF